MRRDTLGATKSAPKVKSDHLWYHDSVVEIFAERAMLVVRRIREQD
jgi:hypothetical protein